MERQKPVECYLCKESDKWCGQHNGDIREIHQRSGEMLDRATPVLLCIEQNGLNPNDFKTETNSTVIYKK